MGRSALARPLPWLAAIAGVALAGVMTFAYVAAFADPVGELEGLPVGIVDLDQPAAVAGQVLDVGSELVATLTAPPTEATKAVQFRVYETRDEVVDAIMDDELAGALIVPAELSQQIGAIGTALDAAPRASIEVIRNPGAGSLQPVVVDTAATTAVDGLNATVSAALQAALTAAGVAVAPADVRSVATPIVQRVTDLPALTTGPDGGCRRSTWRS